MQSYRRCSLTAYSVWLGNVDFRYSDMLFVGSEGTVWTAAHTETADPMADDIPANERLWLNAGRDPLTVWSETGGEGDYLDLVATWLKEHPVPRPEEH